MIAMSLVPSVLSAQCSGQDSIQFSNLETAININSQSYQLEVVNIIVTTSVVYLNTDEGVSLKIDRAGEIQWAITVGYPNGHPGYALSEDETYLL